MRGLWANDCQLNDRSARTQDAIALASLRAPVCLTSAFRWWQSLNLKYTDMRKCFLGLCENHPLNNRINGSCHKKNKGRIAISMCMSVHMQKPTAFSQTYQNCADHCIIQCLNYDGKEQRNPNLLLWARWSTRTHNGAEFLYAHTTTIVYYWRTTEFIRSIVYVFIWPNGDDHKKSHQYSE